MSTAPALPAAICGSGSRFAAIYTAEDIGSYKPDPRNFRYPASTAWPKPGTGRTRSCMSRRASFTTMLPANRCGLVSAWIDRRRGSQGWGATPSPEADAHYDFRFASLAELAAAHRAEHRGA